MTARVPAERLCAWTVNDRSELEHWFERGVGFITSDDPVLALEVRTAMAARS